MFRCCSEERIGCCQEDIDQWRICEIVMGVCWPCKSGKGFGDCARQEIGDGSRNVLFNLLSQALRRATNVPTIAVAHKLINNIAVMMGR